MHVSIAYTVLRYFLLYQHILASLVDHMDLSDTRTWFPGSVGNQVFLAFNCREKLYQESSDSFQDLIAAPQRKIKVAVAVRTACSVGVASFESSGNPGEIIPGQEDLPIPTQAPRRQRRRQKFDDRSE